MSKHLPRRSGVGVRQVLPPAEPQIKPYRHRMAGPLLCGHENPERPALLGQTYRHSTFGCSAVSASSVSA